MDTDVLEQRTAIDYHCCSHWWLVDKTAEKIYDITADQTIIQLINFLHILERKNHGMDGNKGLHQRTLDLMVLVLGDRLVLDKIVDFPV